MPNVEKLQPPDPPPTFVTQVERELAEAGRLDTVKGQLAVGLAQRMFSPLNTGSAIASLAREFRSVMDEALRGTAEPDDPIELLQQEWRKRLDQRSA